MRRLLIAGVLAGATVASSAFAAGLAPLDSDREPDRIDWFDVEAKLGPVPKPAEGTTVGAVAKTLINEYWRLLGDGFVKGGEAHGAKVDLQAAQNEGDQLGQLSIAETMITKGYKSFWSPRRPTPTCSPPWSRPPPRAYPWSTSTTP